jgi:hypothetical protein
MKSITLCLVFLAFISNIAIVRSQETQPIGLEQLSSIKWLPFRKDLIKVGYEGSIDKKGGNADWDWFLYQDDNDEWVIFDIDGPGCVYNFVVHHDLAVSDPVYRFYFDGNKKPTFEIKHSEFGRKYPFIEPLAAKYEPKIRLPQFAIVRSFCPMPFKKSCKITSSVRLHDNAGDPGGGGGGWGHVMYHKYSNYNEFTTFKKNDDYHSLINQWSKVGDDPKSTVGNMVERGITSLSVGDSVTIYKKSGSGYLASIKLNIPEEPMKYLSELWIRIKWDGETSYAVDSPIGAFFGNELGFNDIKYITHGMAVKGDFYTYFPMPFWKSVHIELVNKGLKNIPRLSYEIMFNPDSEKFYQESFSMHFRASAYQPPVKKDSAWDSHIATISGHGHLVSGTITGWENTFCEGDVRVLIDGASTPKVESDGSESWIGYGWGFVNPPQNNPVSGFDGTGNGLWSMTRVCIGDFYPFHTDLRFSVEGGSGRHSGEDVRSGIVFYYGEPEPSMVLTDFIDIGDATSENAHDYKAPESVVNSLTSFYEGEFDQLPVTDEGRKLAHGSSFRIKVLPQNNVIILRRRSDQQLGRQRAKIYIDGRLVKEKDWYYADQNPYKRWLDDEFIIPAKYTKGKSQIEIKIVPLSINSTSTWNEYFYWVNCIGNNSGLLNAEPITLPEKAIPVYLMEAEKGF